MGHVVSVNLAEPRTLERNGEQVPTGIWKLPVDGPVELLGEGVAGDTVGNPTVHGSIDKAAYSYAREDIDWWAGELGRPLPSGTFGENLTLAEVEVTGAVVGERWRVGAALVEVSEPRFPCWKLARKMEDPRFVKRFAGAGRPGAYLRVIEPGTVTAGDAVELIERPDHGLTIATFNAAYLHDRSLLRQFATVPQVSEKWRDWAAEHAA